MAEVGFHVDFEGPVPLVTFNSILIMNINTFQQTKNWLEKEEGSKSIMTSMAAATKPQAGGGYRR